MSSHFDIAKKDTALKSNQQRNTWGNRSYRGATPLTIIPIITNTTTTCWRFRCVCLFLGLHQEVLFRLGWMRLKENQQQVQVCSRLVFLSLVGVLFSLLSDQ